jgi:hypothetical protein
VSLDHVCLLPPGCHAIVYNLPQHQCAPSGFLRSFQMKPYILMVTWLISGQPPHGYQVTFFSEEACAAARDAVLADGRRVKAQDDQVQINAAKATQVDPALFLASTQSPDVSAICAPQYPEAQPCALTGSLTGSASRLGSGTHARHRPLRTAALWWQKLFPPRPPMEQSSYKNW